MLIRRITYRLYPSLTQAAKMFEARRLHAYLYNAALANRKTQYQRLNHSVSYFEQQGSLPGFKETWFEYKALNAGSLQATLKRVDFAFNRFFQGLAKYPKFHSIRKYSGWTYPDARQGFKVHSDGKNGHLELRDLGFKIQMRGQARSWGKPTTCTIVYRGLETADFRKRRRDAIDSSGKWYASLTVQCNPKRETGTGAIGLDFGCKTAIAKSDGEKIEPPKFLAKAQARIKHLAKGLRRKRKPERKKHKASRRWKKAQAKISKVQKRVAQQRQNWVHHEAVDIVRSNSLIATEKLNLKGMTRKAKKGSKRKRQKAGLNRSILDVGIGMLKGAIKYKAIEAGAIYLEAPTRSLKPTQRCNSCWKTTKKTLSDRLHVCSNQECGHTEDRDINAAQVCLTWARGQELSSETADGSSSTESPKSKYCGGMKQLAQAKRQKLMGQRSSHE